MILMVDREYLFRIKFYGIVFFLKFISLNFYCYEILCSIFILFSNEGRKKNKIICFLFVFLKIVINFILELFSFFVNLFFRFIN